MSNCRNPLHCIVPGFILKRMANSRNKEVRRFAIDNIGPSAAMRAVRKKVSSMQFFAAIPSPAGRKYRLIYNGGNLPDLPGNLVRSEGDPKHKDVSVNEAYNFSGYTYDFYKKLFDRNSLDNNGTSLLSTVHTRRRFNNAFWNGEQMAYGDGDGIIFGRFTRSLDVVGHELTHGVVTFTANLDYEDQPGALNEHFADVMGILVRQWRKKETAAKANWLIGAELLTPAPTRRALRDMAAPGTAYVDDPDLGTDPQPKHMNDFYDGSDDYGGVHINSGIPNHAFFKVATALGGKAWEKAGRIWYEALLKLNAKSEFQEAAETTVEVAGTSYDSATAKVVRDAWAAVGIKVPT
jgi:Zn-dependent metalloprotease